MPTLVLATSNPGKLKEMKSLLADTNWDLQLKPEVLDVEETGTTFTENACLKASQVAQWTGEWAIADDSGLEVEALNGIPGVYSARYGQTDADRIDRLLRELAVHPNRKARFVCVMAVAQPDGSIVLQAEGICAGEILVAPRGTGGFGYDPVFYMPEQRLTFAEMPHDLKQQVSHRGQAFQALLPQLKSLF
jgi:XTP/dITP diphosphohydrolase